MMPWGAIKMITAAATAKLPDALGRDKNDNSSRYGKIAKQHSHNAASDAFVHGNAYPSKSKK